MHNLFRSKNRFKKGSFSGNQGFSLIELLITMMVIMIISGLVMTAIGGNDGTNELNSAISRADSVFSLARSAAISRKTPVRVLVSFDPARPEAYLRHLAIYYLDRDAGAWLPFAEGENLPQGIFVDVERMRNNSAELRIWNTNQLTQNILALNPIVEPPPNALPELTTSGNEGPNQWIVFEFHANGTARHPMSRFVVGRALQAARPLNVIPNEFMRAGFVLFRSGKVVHFQSPEHLLGAIN